MFDVPLDLDSQNMFASTYVCVHKFSWGLHFVDFAVLQILHF